MQALAHWFRRTFPHGIHPAESKSLTADKPIRRLPFPPELILPLAQHTGAPSVPLVHPSQEVVRGEPIAEAGGFVSEIKGKRYELGAPDILAANDALHDKLIKLLGPATPR